MTQLLSIAQLSLQLADLKEKKQVLHGKLIDTNRLFKMGQATQEDKDSIKKKMSELTAAIRSMEHDLSILTLTIMKTAAIEETPYGRVIKYQEEDTK